MIIRKGAGDFCLVCYEGWHLVHLFSIFRLANFFFLFVWFSTFFFFGEGFSGWVMGICLRYLVMTAFYFIVIVSP